MMHSGLLQIVCPCPNRLGGVPVPTYASVSVIRHFMEKSAAENYKDLFLTSELT